MVGAEGSSKGKTDIAEVQEKYAVLEMEIRLLRDLRAQVNRKLKKQVQLQLRQSRLFTKSYPSRS